MNATRGMRGAPNSALMISTKNRSHFRQLYSSVLLMLLMAACALATVASAANRPTIAAPVQLDHQFQFTLLGSNVPYIVEASTNLQAWGPVATNTDRSETRVIVLAASESTSFYRAAEATPLFGFAMAASCAVALGGSNNRVDSFDSSDPNYSENGQYDPAKAKPNGNVATASRLPGCINVGNCHVYGKASTGPQGTVVLGSSGSVGDLQWNSNMKNNGKIEPGYVTEDMKIQFANARLPIGSFFVPVYGQIGATNYGYMLDTGYWMIDSLSFVTERIVVTGDAVLYVKSSVSISGSSSITISSGASLQIYIGSSASFAGNGVINPNDASKFMVYGLPTCTNVFCSANLPFTGCVYAPGASLNVGGTNSVTGSFVAKSVSIAGGCSMHYDERLRESGPCEVLSLLP